MKGLWIFHKLSFLNYISSCILRHKYQSSVILGDPGAVSGGGRKAKRARKKIWRRKVKNESRSPWDSSLNRPVPKPFKILACDWAQKYFLCPIRVQLFSCYFRDFLFETVSANFLLACSPFIHLLMQESFPRSKSAIETRTMKPKKKKLQM